MAMMASMTATCHARAATAHRRRRARSRRAASAACTLPCAVAQLHARAYRSVLTGRVGHLNAAGLPFAVAPGAVSRSAEDMLERDAPHG